MTTKTILFFFLLGIMIAGCTKEDDIQSDESIADLYISLDSIYLNNYSQSADIRFQNNIDGEFNITLSYDTSLISLSQDIFLIKSFEKLEVVLQMNPVALEYESIQTDILVRNSDQNIDTISISINNYKFNSIHFSKDIVDIEYSKVLDKIAFISNSPVNALYILDFNTSKWDSIIFSDNPLCIGVSTANTNCVIGFHDKVLLVDMETQKIIQEYPINQKCHDILLSSKDWIYVFTDVTYQSEIFYSINTNTGTVYEFDYSPSLGQINVRMGSNEDYIYGVLSRYGSSEVVYKLEISNGYLTFNNINSKKYDHDHNFWLSPLGKRMYTKDGNVYSISEAYALNLNLLGSLSNSSTILSLELNPENNTIYAINEFQENWHDEFFKTELISYNNNDFSIISNITVNNFCRPDENGEVINYRPNLKNVFLNSSYSVVYVVTRAPTYL